jgi:transcriptional regulator with XRE-family HTH domain
MAKTPVNQFVSEFIHRTRQAREEAKFTQQDISDLLGIGQGTYKNYETHRLMPHNLVPAFCLATRVDIAWLYTGRVPQQRLKPLAAVRRRA